MKRIGILLLSLCLLGATPAFAMTNEQKAALEDNRLEYAEINDLIDTYSPVVIDNRYKLHDFRRLYGTGQSNDDSGDYQVLELTYEMAEKQLQQTARSSMISYYTAIVNKEQADKNVELLTDALNVTNKQYALGMATQTDVLTATESLLAAQQAAVSAEAAITTAKKTLQVMCGWKYESDAEIGALPQPDLSRTATINPAADLDKALAANYTLRINQRKREIATDETEEKTLDATIVSNRQNIASSLHSMKIQIDSASEAYRYALSDAQLQDTNQNQTDVKYSVGMVSALDAKTQRIKTENAHLALRLAEYRLLELLMQYDDAVAGLAGA